MSGGSWRNRKPGDSANSSSAGSIISLRAAHIPLPGELNATRLIDSSSPGAPHEIALAILGLAADTGRSYPITVVCIGTDRSTGDSLGPLVGTMLAWSRFQGTILGDLDSPVHAENLGHAVERIAEKGGLVLGVDACLGTRQEVGAVIVRPGPLRPGLGVKKRLLPVGDLHVAGVVNVGGFMEYMVLQNTRLSVVMRMAQAIASGIVSADSLLRAARDAGGAEETPREDPLIRGVPANAGLQSPLPQAFARLR